MVADRAPTFVVPDKIHLYIHVEGQPGGSNDVVRKLDQIIAALTGIKKVETQMALDTAALVDQVTQVAGTEASATAALTAIQAALADLSAQLADQPAVQAQLDTLVQQLADANAPLAAAIAANPTP